MPRINLYGFLAFVLFAALAIGSIARTGAAVAAASTPQTITFGALANKTFGDPPVFVSATASSGLTVSFSTSGNCTNNNAVVTLTGAGSCTVTASQAGNATYTAATSVQQAFSIAQKAQTINFFPPFGKTFGDPPFNVSATASSGLPVSLASSGQCTGSGASPVTVTITGAGSCSLTASQAGDVNFAAAADVIRNVTIAKKNQSITFPSFAATYGDVPITLAATASSTLPVSYTASGACSVAGASLTIAAAGQCSVTAGQAGDANYNAAPNSFKLVFVARKALTINAPNSTRVFRTDNSTAVPPINAISATGLTNGDSLGSLGTPTCSSFASTLSSVGSYGITCFGLNAPNYNVKYVNGTLTVTKASQSITFAAIPDHAYGDASFSVSATSSSGLGVALSVVSGPCSAGTAPWGPVTITGAGDCTLRASQAGNGNFTAATPVDQAVHVNPKSVTVTADNKVMSAGPTPPAFTFTVSGLVNFDSPGLITGVTCSTAGDTTVPGSYPITCSGGSGAPNYTIGGYVPGTLTVN